MSFLDLNRFPGVNKSDLAWRCWSDGAAVRCAGEGQSRRQLALRYWSRARRATVTQRHWTHSCWASCSAGGTRWAPLSHTFRHTEIQSGPLGTISLPVHEIWCADSPTGSLPRRRTCLQTWSLLPEKDYYLYVWDENMTNCNLCMHLIKILKLVSASVRLFQYLELV